MSKKYYRKQNRLFKKDINLFKTLSLFVIFLGLFILVYVFFPFLSWQIYFAPVFANQNIASPIPKLSMVNNQTLGSLLSEASHNLSGVNYQNAQNWFPTYNPNTISEKANVKTYSISIPILKLENLVVSTVDYDLSKHLVNYQGTAIPPSKGNAVIFGHSTLPQLYNPKDYKTVFANAYKLKVGDEINVTVENITYNYKIISTIVTSPEDTSIFEQNYNDSFLTLVTCTPPGTTWKRLIIKAVLQNI